jgi:hypothetical protein
MYRSKLVYDDRIRRSEHFSPFSTLCDKREEANLWTDIFFFSLTTKRKEREREQGESDTTSIRGVHTFL